MEKVVLQILEVPDQQAPMNRWAVLLTKTTGDSMVHYVHLLQSKHNLK